MNMHKGYAKQEATFPESLTHVDTDTHRDTHRIIALVPLPSELAKHQHVLLTCPTPL